MGIGMSVKDTDHGFKATLADFAKTNVDVVVGVLGSAGESEVIIAAVHEFGSQDGHIPQRSYLRSTIDDRRGEIFDLLELQLKKSKPEVAAGRIGMQVVSMVRERIRDRISPALKPATIKRKGSDIPLIDTGRLLQSITSEVRAK